MGRQKGLTPILIVLLIALAVGGYLIYTNYFKDRILAYKEAESLIVNCKVYSIGQSHKDIEKGYLSLKLRNVDDKDSWFRIDKNYESQIREKIEEVTSSGKCPKVIYWME